MFLLTPALAETPPSPWQAQKSQHFVVYYQDAPADFTEELIERAEDYYNGIMDEFGYRRSDFWSWDKRARIYLYKDAEDFQQATRRSFWAGGVALIGSREIKTFVGQESFFDTVLPHEMTHIIFREFVGDKAVFPLWIEEGVACSQEKASLSFYLQMSRKSVSENKYIKLGELSALNDAGQADPALFYSESAALVVFLLRSQGQESFWDFSRALRDGADWKKALLSIYDFNSLEEMEKAWKIFLFEVK
jgi:hypothetical protein